MQIQTHDKIDPRLVGRVVSCGNGQSTVTLTTTPDMAADSSGLVHGGFIFGLADYAAMIAVNHPNVVLGAADVKFLKPVETGACVEACACVDDVSGKKQLVTVVARRQGVIVFEGRFTCFVLDKHVLKS